MLAPHPPSGMHARGRGSSPTPPIYWCTELYPLLGYSPPGQEKLSQHVYDKNELAKLRAQAPDVKENFECGREDDSITIVWLPDGALPGFKEACLDFFWVSEDRELL